MHHGNTDAYILTHGYTAEDYRRTTNNYHREDYDQLLAEAEAEGNGLGFVYMSSVQKSVKRYEKMWAEYDQVKNFASRSTKDSLMDQINKFNRLVRQKAAQDMQDYIIEHEGRIGTPHLVYLSGQGDGRHRPGSGIRRLVPAHTL